MRIARISYLPMVGLLVIFSACSSPAPAALVTPAPVVAKPVTPSPTPPPIAAIPILPAPAPEQSQFVVSELTMNPVVVMLGDNVIVSVKVTNTGKEREAYTVVVKFNGKTVKAQDIVLDAGVGGKADLSVVAELPGEYRVDVAQLTGILKVVAQ